MDDAQKKIIKIGIGFDNQTILHDGLGEFGFQLGTHISKVAPELRRKYGIQFYFHMRRNLHGLFGESVNYLKHGRRQSKIHFRSDHFSLWHTLNQHVRYAAPIFTKHWMMTVHDFNFLYDPDVKTKEKRKQRFKDWLKLRRVDSVVAISDYVAQDVLTKFSFRNVIRIYNGARDPSGHRPKRVGGLVPNQFFFHLSRMAPSKNPRAILELAAYWRDQDFVLAGPSSPEVESVKRLAALRRLDNVHFFTDVSERQKEWLYANCRAFLLPSFTEGFGLPVIEAMKFGKPVFASNRTCLPEIGGDCAFYWSSFDHDQMKQIIIDGLKRWDDSSILRAATKDRAASFSWESCGTAYVERYLELLGLRP